MTVYESHEINDLYDLERLTWSGARQRIAEAIENEIDEEFFEYIKENFDFDDMIDLTDVNDFIWFDCDAWLEEHEKDNEDGEND